VIWGIGGKVLDDFAVSIFRVGRLFYAEDEDNR
jgi:hypothetical protein